MPVIDTVGQFQRCPGMVPLMVVRSPRKVGFPVRSNAWPKRGLSNAPSMDLAGIWRANRTEKPSLATRRATLQVCPRLFGQFRLRGSMNR